MFIHVIPEDSSQKGDLSAGISGQLNLKVRSNLLLVRMGDSIGENCTRKYRMICHSVVTCQPEWADRKKSDG